MTVLDHRQSRRTMTRSISGDGKHRCRNVRISLWDYRGKPTQPGGSRLDNYWRKSNPPVDRAKSYTALAYPTA